MSDKGNINSFYRHFDAFMPHYMRFINPILHQMNVSGLRLNENQVKVLMAVDKKKGIVPSEVSRLFSIPKTSLTTIIRSLEEHGLLIRLSEPEDARRQRLFLTEKGRVLIDEKHKENIKAFGELFEGMNPETRAKVTEGLLAFNHFFQSGGKEHEIQD